MKALTDKDVLCIFNSFPDLNSEWVVYLLPMSPPLFAAKIYKPEFHSSPDFKTKEEALEWLKQNHPEIFKPKNAHPQSPKFSTP